MFKCLPSRAAIGIAKLLSASSSLHILYYSLPIILNASHLVAFIGTLNFDDYDVFLSAIVYNDFYLQIVVKDIIFWFERKGMRWIFYNWIHRSGHISVHIVYVYSNFFQALVSLGWGSREWEVWTRASRWWEFCWGVVTFKICKFNG